MRAYRGSSRARSDRSAGGSADRFGPGARMLISPLRVTIRDLHDAGLATPAHHSVTTHQARHHGNQSYSSFSRRPGRAQRGAQGVSLNTMPRANVSTR